MNDDSKKILVSDLSYGPEEIEAVIDVLKSEWLTMGPRTDQFEKALAEYLGSGLAVAVNSGTAALHLGLIGLGVQPGDEVLVTPLSFVASANAILYTGARPVFVDVSKSTFNLDPSKLEDSIGERTRAIIPVHIAGLPADMDEINGIASENGLRVLDDAAHAIGSKYRGRAVGTLADATAFSFFSNKNLSVGEGGAVSTQSSDIAALLKLIRSHGLTKSTWSRHISKGVDMDQLYDMVELGYNYRITEISAALGLVQLKKLDQFIKRRKELYCLYHDLLNPLPVELQDIPVHVEHAHHVLPVLVPKGMRVSIRAHLQKKGIGTSIHYTPIHQFTYYKKHGYAAESLPVAEEIGARVVTLPLHQKMSDDDVHRVVLELKSQLD